MLEEFAPAKVNLSLRVLHRRADGYHELESLVSFATIGDRLTLEPGPEPGLALDGPFADDLAEDLAEDGDNIVLAAAGAFADVFPGSRAGRFTLSKNLPVASGLGGGSGDAAAALRLLARANAIEADDPRLFAIARDLGADVPVCLAPKLRWMRGIGHDLGPALPAREMPALLVNPRRPVQSRAVFAELGLAPGATFERPPGGPANDLAAPAVAVEPAIGEVLADLAATEGCRASGMSGSGASCFALYGDAEAAEAAARRLGGNGRGWWIAPCALSLPLRTGGGAG